MGNSKHIPGAEGSQDGRVRLEKSLFMDPDVPAAGQDALHSGTFFQSDAACSIQVSLIQPHSPPHPQFSEYQDPEIPFCCEGPFQV